MVENIIGVYLSANEEDYNEGMEWYYLRNELAKELSPSDVVRGAGVIAAFSPVCPWDRNVVLARNAFSTGIATGHTKAFCSHAQRILDGENTFDVLKGDKTRAFAAAIADPDGSTIATIDRHAHDVAMGRVYSDKERKIGKRIFREMSSAYADAAELAGISLAQIQAVTWLAWRNQKVVAA